MFRASTFGTRSYSRGSRASRLTAPSPSPSRRARSTPAPNTQTSTTATQDRNPESGTDGTLSLILAAGEVHIVPPNLISQSTCRINRRFNLPASGMEPEPLDPKIETRDPRPESPKPNLRPYFTESVNQIVLPKSLSAQSCQLVLYENNNKG